MRKALVDFENELEQELVHVRELGLERTLIARPMPTASGTEQLLPFDFSSNDYLRLSRDPRVIQASQSAATAGAGSARLIHGTRAEHLELEQRIAHWQGREAALLYGAGYLANIGVVSGFFNRNDVLFSDRYVHASLIDGILLSRCRHRRFWHNDCESLEMLLAKESQNRAAKTRFCIVAESVYSMDGDLAPLEDLVSLANRYEALLFVDEAHAAGVFGAGRVASANLQNSVDIISGSFGKAFGGYGGFVATSKTLCAYLLNNSRSFIFNTAPPPSVVLAALSALAIMSEHPEQGAEVLTRAKYFRDLLLQGGAPVGLAQSQIIPLLIGDSHLATELANRIRARGVLVVAIRPPTVPEGSARLRFSVNIEHSPHILEEAAAIVLEEAQASGICR